MKSLEEILKSSGLNAATAKANGGSTPEATPDTALEEDEELCTRCGGAGFVRKAVRLGHPDFGKAFPCECIADEREDQRLARLQRYSNLGPLARLTFADLSPLGRSPNPSHQEHFSRAVGAARSFAEQPEGWLVLTGPNGCGKTHLASAIAGRCIEAGTPALFMVVPDLLDHLRSAYQPGSDVAYDDLFELVRTAPVLVLDDLGVQSSTPWAQEKLFQLVNHRYNAQLPTVFTTNLDPTEFDGRIQSRLTDGTLSQVHYLESGARIAIGDLDALELPHLRAMTFKSFDPQIVQVDHREEVSAITNAYRQAMKYAEDPKEWLLIAGVTGRGKTRLAAAIGNYCRDIGLSVMMVVVPDLLDWLRIGFSPHNPRSFDELFERVKNVHLLILDDLGSQSSTPWADEKLFQLLNYRYNASLPTVVTTNANAAAMGARIRTRLTDPQISSMLLMGGFDFWGKADTAGAPPIRPRGRPPRRP
jgi:DNA replication protein DnaC